MPTDFKFDIWTCVGLVGQAIFASRFFIQWIASEKRGESYIPIAFWWLSLTGSIILAVYFIVRMELVGIVGYVPNSIVYIRNLQLLRKRAKQPAQPPPPRAEVAAGGPPGDGPREG